MSNKTRTISTTGSTKTLRAVPDQDTTAKVRTDTEDKLWEALHANPNSTAADLAGMAKIGKSTAGKILVKWQKDGSVTRTAGIARGGRAADLWAITATSFDAEPTDHIPTDATAPSTSADDVSATDSTDRAQPDPAAPDTTSDDAKLSEAQPADGGPDEAPSTAVIDTAKPEPGVESTTPAADNTAPDGDGDTAVEGSGGYGKQARLAPGTLRGMVEDYLRDHPGEEFGPTSIAKALGGKSSGAVSNALDKLVADSTAVRTKESPRRFALAPVERETAPAATK